VLQTSINLILSIQDNEPARLGHELFVLLRRQDHKQRKAASNAAADSGVDTGS
jgi:hypothetical protein